MHLKLINVIYQLQLNHNNNSDKKRKETCCCSSALPPSVSWGLRAGHQAGLQGSGEAGRDEDHSIPWVIRTPLEMGKA